jgi:hypothetical protein
MRARVLLFLTVLLVPELVSTTTALQRAVTSEAVPANALWEPPAGLHDRDLFYGPWGSTLQPDPHAIYTFVRRKQKGTNPGVVVRDPQGREWHVKQSSSSGRHPEGPVEVVISRVLSAVGYHQPPVYYVPTFMMRDGNGKGAHSEVGGRFRLHDPSMRDVGNWSWDDPLVKGSRPYNGLLVMLLAFASWDLKESNNFVYDVQRNGRVERWYMVRDLGGALGSEGTLRPTRNDIAKFEGQGFIKGLNGGYVEFDYGGKRGDLYRRRITIDDVRWATGLLASLDDRQWRDAFRAGGYPSDLSGQFIRKIQANVREGQRLASNPRTFADAKW